MIPAPEALRLPSAQLSPEESAAADALDAELDAHLNPQQLRVVGYRLVLTPSDEAYREAEPARWKA